MPTDEMSSENGLPPAPSLSLAADDGPGGGSGRLIHAGRMDRGRGQILILLGCAAVVAAIASFPLSGLLGLPVIDGLLDRWAVHAPASSAAGAQSPTLDRAGRRVYRITYTFTDPDGVERFGSSLSRDKWLAEDVATRPGTVELLPADSRISRLERTRNAAHDPVYLAVPLGLVQLGAFLIVLGVTRRRRFAALIEAGRLCTGRIERLVVLPGIEPDCERARVAVVHYALDAPGSRPGTSPVRGRLRVLMPHRDALQVGRELRFLVDPRSPARHVPVDLLGVVLRS
jgi:hypothetical protein